MRGLLRPNLVSLDAVHVLVLEHPIHLLALHDESALSVNLVLEATTVPLHSLLVVLNDALDVRIYHDVLLAGSSLCPV